jgi:flagellar biosynthesis/type III secretory pathway protein FliH
MELYLHKEQNNGDPEMRWQREERVEAALTAIERIVHSDESAYRKLLLVDCVQGYAPLEPSQQIELRELLNEPERGITPMIKTLSDEWIEEALAKGLEQGRGEGRAAESRRLLTLQLEQRFGPLSEAVRQRVQTLTVEQIEPLMVAILTARSLDELGLG